MAFPVGWGRRCSITLSHADVDSDLTDFPVLITEACLPSEMFDSDGGHSAQLGGGDIRFSLDSVGNSPLACEISIFITDTNPANGKASIFVKVPTLFGSVDTTIYVWYDGPPGSIQPLPDAATGSESVWKSAFKGVWHLGSMARTIEDVRYLGGYEGTNPAVPLGGTGESDRRIREIGNAVWDSNTSQYLMVYTGYDAGLNSDEMIHGATSPDGKTWTKCTTKPLISARRAEDPYLAIDGSTYYIFAEDKQGGGTGIRCWSNNVFDEDWDTGGTDHGNVFTPGSGWDSAAVASPAVWKEGSTWFLLYEGTDTDFSVAEIGLATSSSPTSGWSRDPTNPIFAPADTAWASGFIAADDIWKDADGFYHMLYHGQTGSGPRCGLAKSTSANDLTAWTDSPGNVVLSDADTAATVEHCETWQVLRKDDGFLFYYYRSGDDSGIYVGYGFGEFGTGTIQGRDSTANDNHPTLTGTRALVAGKFGYAFDFNGSTHFAKSDHVSLDLSDQFWLSLWVNGDNDPDAGSPNEVLAAKGDGNYRLFWGLSDANYRKAITYSPNNPANIQDTTNLATGTWYYFCGLRGATNHQLHRDGVNRASSARVSVATDNDPFRIGAGGTSGAASIFNGRLQEVRVANADLGIAWHKAEYSNMNAPGTFATEGTPESPGPTLSLTDAIGLTPFYSGAKS